jgi:hypothetical protein
MSFDMSMMASMHYNHQEGNVDNSINIKALHQMHDQQTNNTLTHHNNTKRTIQSIRPNYNHTILHRHKIISRLQQLNYSSKLLEEKLHYRTIQRHQQSHRDTTEEWIGDEMNFHDTWETGEYNKSIHICSININGISQDLDWIEWDINYKLIS